MAYDIKIYGDIDSTAGKKGCCSLVDVQNQLSKAEGQDVRVRINSYGGDVDEGFAIYSELRRYSQENKARVITMAEGRCASIATVIFLAGDERIVSRFIDPFVHNAWTETAGNASHFRQTADELERVDKMIAQHYAEHTNLSFDQALQLMGADTSLKPSECEALRFATRVETVSRPVALKQILNNYKPNIDMNTKNKRERWDIVNKVAESLGLKVKNPEAQNKIVFTVTNTELDFYELDELAPVGVGDKANFDGKPAEGEFTVPDKDSNKVKKYIFENGTLIEIIDEDVEDVEALKAELEALKAEKLNADTEIESLNKEVETVTEVMAKLKTTYDTILSERNTFKAKADSLELKIKNAKGNPINDPKHDEGKPNPKAEEVSAGVQAYRESKFKNTK